MSPRISNIAIMQSHTCKLQYRSKHHHHNYIDHNPHNFMSNSCLLPLHDTYTSKCDTLEAKKHNKQCFIVLVGGSLCTDSKWEKNGTTSTLPLKQRKARTIPVYSSQLSTRRNLTNFYENFQQMTLIPHILKR